MKKIFFLVFIFCWNLAICQNQNAFVIRKENGKVFKFKLPSAIKVQLKNRYKRINGEKVYDEFKVMLVKVSHDSMYTTNLANFPNRLILWDSIEVIKFMSSNSTTKAINPFFYFSGAYTLIFPFLFTPFYLPALIPISCFSLAPAALIKLLNSERTFYPNECVIIN